MQHLDRVVPSWEQPSKDLSSTEAATINKLLSADNNLDFLERELHAGMGMSSNSIVPPSKANAFDAEVTIESAPPSRHRKSTSMGPQGLIPSHWIVSFFSGSLPPAQAATLIDWALFNNKRFASVYFAATLFILFSESLMKMNAVMITQWIEEIATNKADWFQHAAYISASNDLNITLTWPSFVRGWIHASAGMTFIIYNSPTTYTLQAIINLHI